MDKKFTLAVFACLTSLILCAGASAQTLTPGKEVPREGLKSLVKEFGKKDKTKKFQGEYISKFWLNLMKKAGAFDPDEEDEVAGNGGSAAGSAAAGESGSKTKSDAETEAMLKAMEKLEGMLLAEYEGCSEALKAEFNARVAALLEGVSLLGEEELEDDETHQKAKGYIYGGYSGGGTVKDLVIYSPEGSALLCIYGVIPLSALLDGKN